MRVRSIHLTGRWPRLLIAAWLLVVSTVALLVTAPTAQAGIFSNDTEYTYKEYWADHSSYTAGCGAHAVAGNSWYVEPEGCVKTIDLQIPDDTSRAIAAVVYVDLWRNRPSKSARFTINDGPQFRPQIGQEFSRTPFSATVALTQLRQGANQFKFQESTGPYHVHDLMIRVYYDAANPLIPGPNSDVTPPSGVLTGIRAGTGPTFTPAQGGTLAVDGNQITLSANATGAAYVEFHAYYDGFDEDNDGRTLDWHNFLRNNYGPGGTTPKSTGATIGHAGTDATSPYEVNWNVASVANQSGVKFKVRIVDAAGNVREAVGGASAAFNLQRSYSVETYTIPGFVDRGLFFDGVFAQGASDTIQLPTDLSAVTRAIMLGNYWSNPDISLNDNPPFRAFVGSEDTWATSRRDLDVKQLRPGANTIRWNYRPPGFGAMVEGPGPMIVLHRALPSGPPQITTQPVGSLVASGRGTSLSVTATGSPTLSYAWLRNGTAIGGATSNTYATPALSTTDDGTVYSVRVTNAQGSVTSAGATVNVSSDPGDAAPWWDARWSYRTTMTVLPDAVRRTDKIVTQSVDFSALMKQAGAGGPTFDPNSIRVVEIGRDGVVIDAAIPFQFDPSATFDPVDNATGILVWQIPGVTPPTGGRYFQVYFDKTNKGIAPAAVAPQVRRSDTTDEGFSAYRFDLADGSSWFFHNKDGGGFSSIVDRTGADWLGWNSAPETAGDYRGLPNAVKGGSGYMHPGRPGKTTSTVLREGPLRITFQTVSKDNAWVAVWDMYPTYATFRMTRAPVRFWFLFEGLPGGEVDAGDFIRRSDGTQVPIDGTFEADLPGREWMYAADPADGRSLYIAHHQDDGAVESYRLLDGAMPVLGFGRGGLGSNYPYLRTVEDGRAQTFTVGLAESVAPAATAAVIDDAERPLIVNVGATTFNGVNTGPRSDDFSGATLDPMWTYTNPVGDVTLGLDGSNLAVAIPAGPGHDLWHSRNQAPRITQAVGNSDIDIVASFGSSPAVKGVGHGFVMVQDATTWIRYSVEYDGTQVRVAAYLTANGTTTSLAKTNLSGVAPRYLRVVRTGDKWRFERSFNASNWTALPTLNVPFTLTAVGLAGLSYNQPTSSAYTVDVDYFESRTAGPFADDAPRLTDVSVSASARRATVTWSTNVATDSHLAWGPTVDIGRSRSDAKLATAHAITIDFLRCDTPYWFKPSSTGATGSASGAVVAFRTAACPTIISDDFSGAALGAAWRVHDPVGDAIIDTTGTNAIVSLPSGTDHNLYANANRAPRLRQEGPIGDFGVEVKFESVLTKRFQTQGIVVEEDEDSFLRFEVHHDGTSVRTYAASILDGVATTYAYGTIPAAPQHFIRVTRVGNSWTMWYSADGSAWVQQAVMVVGLEAAYVGPYIGTTATGSATAPAFLGSIDYFFNVASPISPEDGGAGPDVVPPVISAVVGVAGQPTSQSARISWTTNEPSTTRVDWGFTTAYSSGTLVDNLAVRNHMITVEPLNCGMTYRYRVQSNDAAGNTGSSTDQSMTTAPCPAGAFSDNFDETVLDPRWFVDDPRLDSSYVEMNGLLALSVPAASRHDLTATNNGAYRVLQAAPNGDFQVIVGFESVVNFQSQLQGVMFEQDDNNLVRFDLFSDGQTTKAFVGTLTSNPAKLTTLATLGVPGAVPGSLRVTRTGANWKFEYSPNRGQTWQLVHEGTVSLSVARMGPYSGNANPTIANVPAHTALIDYFWSSSDPIAITTPGGLSKPEFTIFDGDGTAWDGRPLVFGRLGVAQPDVNVLGRVVDPDGIASITYSVNGGEPVTMGLGSTTCAVGVSCTRRLAHNGDFNADVPVSRLIAGANTATIRAVDKLFNVASVDVPVDYTPGNTWPMPYTANWTGVTDLGTVAQPVDGRWIVQGDTVRVDEIGYDRLLAVGDTSWSSFEAEVPITIEGWDPAGYQTPSGGPGIGFIPHWNGHVQAGTTQPKFGFAGRLGALAWYRYRSDVNAERLEIRDSNASLVAEDLTGVKLTVGKTYVFKLRAESGTGANGPTYSLRVWLQGTPEPTAWNLRTALPPGAPDRGSLALVAHHVKARFGTLTVREVTADAPTVSPTSGTYAGLEKVTMSTTTGGGQVRYTLDGSVPTDGSPLYVEPFFVERTTTVRARTFRSGFLPSSTASADYTITPGPARIADALQVLYRFDEGAGSTASDTSFVGGEAIDLTVAAGSDVTWLPDRRALRINGPSVIRTPGGASRLNTAIKASQSFSVEMWIDPASKSAAGATLFNLATEVAGQQNLALTQQGLALDLALRTTNTDADGDPKLATGGVGQSQLHHLVYTRASDGSATVYIDGLSVYTGSRKGSLNSWSNGYALSLGNSVEGVNPWTGDLYLAAVYSAPLTSAQVTQNYRSGPFPASANYPPVVDAGADVGIVHGDPLAMAATASDDGRPNPSLTTQWSKVSGPGSVAFGDPTNATTSVAFSASGTYVLQWSAFDGEKTSVDQVQVAVVAAGTQVVAPTVTPASGPYPGRATVTMTTPTPGAQIHYTTDGSAPTAASTQYTASFDVTTGATVRAIAVRTNMTPSPIVDRTYVITTPNRVGDGLLALYPFNDPIGTTVTDTSGVGSALNLSIANIARTARVPSGLTINQSTTVTSSSADKVNTAIGASGAVTVELWVAPKDIAQTNAMMFGISSNANTRNAGVIQSGSRLDAYIRSTASNTKGEPGVAAVGALAGPSMTHIVYTRDAGGAAAMFVNGNRVTSATAAGSLSSWVAAHQLHLGGEQDGTKSWLGTYYMVAVYGRALSAGEVLQNYAFGDV